MSNANRLPRGFRQDTNLGRIRDNVIHVGVIKRNDDFQRMGRLAVWIPEIGGDPNDEQNWFIVNYASPFAGVTSPNQLVEDSTEMEGSQQSYGFWMQPPDLENHVLVCFANGDTMRGYWFACIYQQNMNHMVPGIASAKPASEVETCTNDPPTVEYNKWSKENPSSPKRPVFKPLHNGLSAQGLYKDDERGVSSSSVRREAPSKLYGWLTPRGNSVHVDDNPDNEFIRFRTRSGAQVLIHETTGFVYINSKNGNSWVEISDDGVDIYSAGSVSLRSQGSLNLHADGSLNIEADGNLNLRAGGNLMIQSAHHTHVAGNGDLALGFGGKITGGAGGNLELGAGGALRLGAGGDISQTSGGNNVRAAAKILDNAGGAPGVNIAKPQIAPVQSLPEVSGQSPCYEETTRQTITQRLPTHEPYKGHPSHGKSNTDVAGGGTTVQPNEVASAEDNQSISNTNVVPTDDPILADANELDWLAICIYTEAAGESDEGKAAVAQIVKNRMQNNFKENALNPSWSGIKQFVLAYAAYSYFWSSNGLTRDIRATKGSDARNANGAWWKQAEQRGLKKMQQVKNSPQFAKCREIGQKVMQGTFAGSNNYQLLRSNARTCNWYANLSTVRPSWANKLSKVSTIGHHTFFKR